LVDHDNLFKKMRGNSMTAQDMRQEMLQKLIIQEIESLVSEIPKYWIDHIQSVKPQKMAIKD